AAHMLDAPAPQPPRRAQPASPPGQSLSESFNSQDQTGAPIASACQPSIDASWGAGAPAPGVNLQGFSVRWTGTPTFTLSSYTFTASTATSADGLRILIDGEKILDQWASHAATTYTSTLPLAAGPHH